jgi:Tfp pilus assembly protein PilO
MTVDLRPWRRLLPVWLPAVGLCVAAAALYLWQSSESGGRAASLRSQIEEFEAEKARLEGLLAQVEGERAAVAKVNESFDVLYGQVFRSLDERLTNILREVGLATRTAGLLPGTYKYAAEDDQKMGYIRFSIQFAVTGEYAQIRKLIAAIQSSPEFLVVEQLAFAGDEGAITQDLKVSVRVATYLSEADRKTLDRLTGGIRDVAAAGDAPPPAGAPEPVPADAGGGLTADGEAQPIGGGDAEAEG